MNAVKRPTPIKPLYYLFFAAVTAVVNYDTFQDPFWLVATTIGVPAVIYITEQLTLAFRGMSIQSHFKNAAKDINNLTKTMLRTPQPSEDADFIKDVRNVHSNFLIALTQKAKSVVPSAMTDGTSSIFTVELGLENGQTLDLTLSKEDINRFSDCVKIVADALSEHAENGYFNDEVVTLDMDKTVEEIKILALVLFHGANDAIMMQSNSRDAFIDGIRNRSLGPLSIDYGKFSLLHSPSAG